MNLTDLQEHRTKLLRQKQGIMAQLYEMNQGVLQIEAALRAADLLIKQEQAKKTHTDAQAG